MQFSLDTLSPCHHDYRRSSMKEDTQKFPFSVFTLSKHHFHLMLLLFSLTAMQVVSVGRYMCLVARGADVASGPLGAR